MNNDINNYIYSLNYDPKKLIAIPGDKIIDSEPFYTEENEGSEYILCTNSPKNLSSEMFDISLLNGIEGVIYPGSLVRVNQDLASGRPTPISIERAPLTLNINLPGLKEANKISLENPTYSETTSNINKSIEVWLSQNDYKIASKQQFGVSDFYSDKQVALELGFDLKWASADLKTKLEIESKSTKSCVIAMYKQIFYTVTLDIPPSPSEFFKEIVTVDNLKNIINNDNPLGYIRSVDYGRMFFVKIESSSADSHHTIKEVLKVTLDGKSIDQNLTEEEKEVLKNSTISVISLGGNASEAAKVLICSNLDELKKAISDNAELTKSNLGIPISYSASFAKDNTVAIITSTANYVEKKYEIFNNTTIELEHSGAYIAEVMIDCKKRTIDANGKLVLEPIKRTTGKITSPKKYHYDFPGCFTDIIVNAGENSALVWDHWEGRKSWRGIFKSNLKQSPVKKIKIYGTTLSPKFSIEEK